MSTKGKDGCDRIIIIDTNSGEVFNATEAQVSLLNAVEDLPEESILCCWKLIEALKQAGRRVNAK